MCTIICECADQNVGILFHGSLDLISNGIFRALEIFAHVASVVHEGEEVVVDTDQLEVLAFHIRHLHVVGGRADVFQLFTFIRWFNT